MIFMHRISRLNVTSERSSLTKRNNNVATPYTLPDHSNKSLFTFSPTAGTG